MCFGVKNVCVYEEEAFVSLCVGDIYVCVGTLCVSVCVCVCVYVCVCVFFCVQNGHQEQIISVYVLGLWRRPARPSIREKRERAALKTWVVCVCVRGCVGVGAWVCGCGWGGVCRAESREKRDKEEVKRWVVCVCVCVFVCVCVCVYVCVCVCVWRC